MEKEWVVLLILGIGEMDKKDLGFGKDSQVTGS